MENRFHMQYCRFHVTEKNKFLVCGFWGKNCRKDADILVSLDYTPAAFEVQKQKTIKTPAAYVQFGECEEKYFFWVSLPDDYRKYKKIRIFERRGLKLSELFSADTAWLEELRDRIHMTVDEVSFGGQGTIVRGWYIAREEHDIRLLDRWGKELSFRISTQRRPDVALAYPECSRDWIHGYILETDVKVSGKVQIITRCDGKEETVKKAVSSTLFRKLYRKGKEIAKKTWVYYQQFGLYKTIRRGAEKLLKQETGTYEAFRMKYFPKKKELDAQRAESFAYEPEISIVVPLYQTPRRYIEELISSVQAQTYGKWRLYLSDGSGENPHGKEILESYAKKDGRICVIQNESSLRISENTNRALQRAEGDFIAFTDHDDTLAPDALYECVKAVNQFPETDIIYTDEDKVSIDGKRYYQPHFKPDFNIDLLRSANYMCHLYVVRKSLLDEVGHLNPEYDGSQDYDFILRCVEKTKNIIHIPKILYHWRVHPNSVAGDPNSKAYAYEAGRNAILAHYKRVGIDARIDFVSPGFYHSVYKLKEEPLVSIIIPSKDHRADLHKCIRSIQEKSDYRNFEILVIENNSEEEETWEYYQEIAGKYEYIRIIRYEGSFNYSAIQNFAVQKAKGEYLLLLNNDTWLKNPESIREMLGYCMREDVGIVGARLLYPDDTIQHAGVIVGLGGVAGHAFLGAEKNDPGYFCRIMCAQNYSAVTAACMMVKKSVYNEAGGMDTELRVAFNDTDFCMRVGEKGYRIVYQPFSVWYHDESRTRGREDTEEKVERFRQEIVYFQRRWKQFLESGDPNYNLNLALDRHDFSLRR